MKKRIRIVAATLALAMGLMACGASGAKEVDAQALAQSLISEITYAEVPAQISAEDIENYIMVEEGVEGIMYMTSGASAEEVAVFTAPDEETAITMKENVEVFLEEQSMAMAAYEPASVERIKNAVVEQNGKYVVLCVSDETDKAQEIIKEAFGK